MALLRWMHLRKLVPLAELMEQLGGGAAARPAPSTSRIAPPGAAALPPRSRVAPQKPPVAAPKAAAAVPPRDAAAAPADGLSGATLKDALLAEIRAGKKILYELSIACAQRIDVGDEAVTFTFGPNQNAARGNLEQSRAWIEAAAQRLAGRRMNIVVVQSVTASAPPPEAASASPARATPPAAPAPDASKAGVRDLKAEAMSSSAVQAMLDVFPAEIRDVEEM
jgi:hypothetical protein